MKLDVINLSGKKVSSFEAESSVFGIDSNISAVRQAVLSEMANMRQGTHSSKNRAKVNGGGKSRGNKKVAVLPVQGLFVRLFGEEAELFSGPSLTNIERSCQRN